MKNYTKHILSLGIALISLNAMAQNMDIDNGNDLYERLQFKDAAEAYEQGLSEIFYLEPAFKLANAYMQMGKTEKAEYWYGQVVIEKKGDATVHLNYARALQANGKYDLAIQQYEKYHKINPIDRLGVLGIQACEDAKDLAKRPPSYAIKPLVINSRASDMAPSHFGEGIIFASTRVRKDMREVENGYDENAYYDLYTSVPEEGGVWSLPKVVTEPLNGVYHEGPVAINEAEDVIVFTTTQYKPGAVINSFDRAKESKVINLKLMISTKKPNGEWTKPADVPFNSKEFSNAHPTFTKDGDYMYFVSDRIEGKGGTDIYIVRYKGENNWDEPINVDFLNTAADEMFPMVDATGDLFFASNGHPGLGGLDVFRAFFNKEKRKYDDVMNLGPPVNTRFDDFGFLLARDGKTGFVSSNRPGGFGSDDIYGVNAESAILRVKVQNSETDEEIANAEVEVSLDNVSVGKATTNSEGSFNFPFEANKNYTLTVQADSFRQEQVDLSTGTLNPGQVYRRKLGLMPDQMIAIKGLIIEDQSKLPLVGSTILLYNLENGNVREVKSDNKGLFLQEVSPDLKYALVGFKNGYGRDSLIIDTKGMKKTATLEKTLSLKEGDRIYSVSFSNVYFAYNKSTLQPSAKAELDQMVEIMKLSPELKVEISAHTDCRGPNEFNMALSERRAQAVVAYLKKFGVNGDRVKPKGYGETRLTNGCKDGVTCSEEEHARNRRVEFAVMDENNETIQK